ncbi:MAG: peptidoglycan DD-metalloendopeptidase family protein [Candidatus Eisenbacteria bacterium]
MTRSCAKAGPGPRAGARRTTLGWIAVAVIALCVGVGNPGWGADVDARRAELEKLKGQIESNRGEIEKLRAREAEKEQLQVTIDRDRDLTRRYLEQLAAQERDLRDSQSERQKDLLALEVRIDETTDRLRRRLLHYYKLRHVKGGELLFSSNSFPEVFARSQFLVRMIEHDRVDLLALAQDRAEAARVSSQITERRQELDGLIAEKKREETGWPPSTPTWGGSWPAFKASGRLTRRACASWKRRRAGSGSSSNSWRRHVRKGAARPSVETSRSCRDACAGRCAGAWSRSSASRCTPSTEPRCRRTASSSRLPRAPRFRPRPPVASSSSIGTTATGGPSSNHGGGFHTLYAHASAVLVHRGDTVTAGEEIARVGDTDSVRGFCLHFEVRRQQDGARSAGLAFSLTPLYHARHDRR